MRRFPTEDRLIARARIGFARASVTNRRARVRRIVEHRCRAARAAAPAWAAMRVIEQAERTEAGHASNPSAASVEARCDVGAARRIGARADGRADGMIARRIHALVSRASSGAVEDALGKRRVRTTRPTPSASAGVRPFEKASRTHGRQVRYANLANGLARCDVARAHCVAVGAKRIAARVRRAEVCASGITAAAANGGGEREGKQSQDMRKLEHRPLMTEAGLTGNSFR
jgi:hypothetical protein